MQALFNTVSGYLTTQIISTTQEITPVDQTTENSKNDVQEQDLVNSTKKIDLNDKENVDTTFDNQNQVRPESTRYDSSQILKNSPGGSNDPAIVNDQTPLASAQTNDQEKKTSLLADRPAPTHYQTNALAHESTKKPIPATLDDTQSAMKEQLDPNSNNSHRTDQLRAPNAGLDVISGVATQPTSSTTASRAVNYTDEKDHSQFAVGHQNTGNSEFASDSKADENTSSYDNVGLIAEENVLDDDSNDQKAKVSVGDKISGSFEKMVGKITKNEAKIEHGELKKTGQLQD